MNLLATFPGKTNFYAVVRTAAQPEEVARLFQPPTWRCRKSSWTDFEAISDFAELTIESSDPVLVHGPVADPTVNGRRIAATLVAAELSGWYECYDEAGALVTETPFGPAAGSFE